MLKLKRKQLSEVAIMELNTLNFLNLTPTLALEKARVLSTGTPVFDINGEILFYRFPLKKGKKNIGFVDLAANEKLGEPLMSTTTGMGWNEKAIKEEALSVARKTERRLNFSKIQFVAYSYPKIGIQFLNKNREVLMLELFSWEKVPAGVATPESEENEYGMKRWSFLDYLPASVQRKNANVYEERIGNWERAKEEIGLSAMINRPTIQRAWLEELPVRISLSKSRELHFSKRNTDHMPCYEVRGQETGVWCVGASVQMLLDYYRYEYDQTRLAVELGLGTPAHPNGLPYGNEYKVVDTIEDLSSNALDATADNNPKWNLYVDEINQNRPLISFVPGHSRCVAGYYESRIAVINSLPYKGLLVYDPWPPNVGAITKWENFNTHTYRYAFTAKVTKV